MIDMNECTIERYDEPNSPIEVVSVYFLLCMQARVASSKACNAEPLRAG
jgi:hypothetical protein